MTNPWSLYAACFRAARRRAAASGHAPLCEPSLGPDVQKLRIAFVTSGSMIDGPAETNFRPSASCSCCKRSQKMCYDRTHRHQYNGHGFSRTELSWQLRVATRQTVSMSGYSRLFRCWNGPLMSVHNTRASDRTALRPRSVCPQAAILTVEAW
jgi:hypothetical protein